MYEKIYDKPDVYKIYVPLPNNPLKNLNCYVVKTPEKNLIIDTGFNMPECYKALTEGLDELGIDLKNTELFATHLHSDHIGLISKILPKGNKIYMSKVDYSYWRESVVGDAWLKAENQYLDEGFPEEQIGVLRSTNPARSYAPDGLFDAELIDDGYKFNIGEYEFTAILTPGHTPGHMCLYIEKEKLMFLGDHVLFDITPNITCWNGVENSLADYLKSLEKIKSFDIVTALPAHRQKHIDFYERVEQILEHHKRRLKNTMDIITENDGFTAHDIAAEMKWKMRGKNWDEFPPEQKWFAMGETISHLDYLIIDGKIRKEKSGKVYRYYKI